MRLLKQWTQKSNYVTLVCLKKGSPRFLCSWIHQQQKYPIRFLFEGSWKISYMCTYIYWYEYDYIFIYISTISISTSKGTFFLYRNILVAKEKSPPKPQNCKVVKVNSDASSNSMDAPIATWRHRNFWGKFVSDPSYFWDSINKNLVAPKAPPTEPAPAMGACDPRISAPSNTLSAEGAEGDLTTTMNSSPRASLTRSRRGSTMTEKVGGLKFGEVGDFFFLWMIFLVILEDVYRYYVSRMHFLSIKHRHIDIKNTDTYSASISWFWGFQSRDSARLCDSWFSPTMGKPFWCVLIPILWINKNSQIQKMSSLFEVFGVPPRPFAARVNHIKPSS